MSKNFGYTKTPADVTEYIWVTLKSGLAIKYSLQNRSYCTCKTQLRIEQILVTWLRGRRDCVFVADFLLIKG